MHNQFTAWVARDKDDQLWLFDTPQLLKGDAEWYAEDGAGEMMSLDSDLLPSVSWDDPAPTQVTITLTPPSQ